MKFGKKNRIRLSEHFDIKKLLRFSAPSVVMLVFTSVYTIVDGVFVSNFVGESAFAGLNLIFPVLIILGAVGLMFGAGGSAIISRKLGEGDREGANACFTLFTVSIAATGIVLGVAGFFCIPPLALLLGKGATAETVAAAELYGKVYLCGMPFFMLQYAFQSYFITAEKATLGFFVTVAAGLVNAVLDALFIVGFRWGLVGAGAATVCGQVLAGVFPLIYFARRNNSLLRFVRPRFQPKELLSACANGSSELLTNISASVLGILYNATLLRYAGDNGVIAYGVVMYVSMIFTGIFYGFAMGVAPVIGFHYGARNREELGGLFRRSLIVLTSAGVILTVLAELLALPFSRIFVQGEAFELTVTAMRLYSVAYLVMGVNLFASAFFTALGNGLVSAVLSLLRTLLFQCGAVLLLPLVWGLTGVWLAVVFSELISFVVSLVFFVAMRKKYGYWGIDSPSLDVIE